MKEHLQIIVLAALAGGTASHMSAQERQPAPTRPTVERAGFREAIPRGVLRADPLEGEMYRVKMLNHNIGWALGGSRTHTALFRTADGGKSWERQTMFDGAGSRLRDIGFADANNGWMVGDSEVLRTTDGGELWTPVNVDQAVGKGYSIGASDLVVLGPNAIVVGTDGQNRQIMRTLDAGSTWEKIGLVKDGGGGAGSENAVTGLALGQGSTIFATTGAHYKGVIYRSDDGGASWESVAEAEKPLFDIAVRGRRGVAVGENIAFFTEDGGDTWRRVAIAGRRYAVDFIDPNTILAVGRDPSVVVSHNGGKTWQAAPGPVVEVGALVDIHAVDPGWVFMASSQALHHFVDPNHTEPLATGRLPIPVDVQIPGGKALPRGVYDVMFGHRGDQHVIRLDRQGELSASGQSTAASQSSGSQSGGSESPGDQESSAQLDAAVARQKSQKPPACASPCTATFPAGVTYEKEDAGAGGAAAKSFFRIALEPTASGVAVVVRTALTPPRNVALALTAVGAPQSSDGEVRDAAKTAAKKGGGLFGRIQKAAAGDVRGAMAGAPVNPQAAQQRLRTAKAAPPAVYKVTVRHTLDLFGEKKN